MVDLTSQEFMKSLDEHRFYHDQGLRKGKLFLASPPSLEEHEKVIDLPESIRSGNTVYGTEDEFIEYLRTVNGIPHEAQLEVDKDIDMNRYRIRFVWWTVEGWVYPTPENKARLT